MLPPRLVRRLLLAPLVVVIAAALVALTPAVAVLTVAFGLVKRRTRSGRPRRGRLLRVVWVALAWSVGETAVLTVLLCLWLVSGFGGRIDTEPYRTRHYAVMQWFLDLIYRATRRASGLRVEVAAPPDAGEIGDRPLIVLSRHAGPGDSIMLVHYLLTECGRRPRIVMKSTLQLDPSIDVVANRVPNAFLHPRPRRGDRTADTGPGASGRQQTELIRRLAAGLDAGSALVIFPEGANWTPQRWRRGIERLRRDGHADLAERAAAMPSLLPPHSGGVSAAISACPEADVIFVAHTGLDRLVGIRDVWHSLLTDVTVQARWWRVPAASVPRAAGHDAQVEWLYDWWERIDAWIAQASPAAMSPAPPATAPSGE
jgi:1-acyl-sn-glycerol-3-phosphate acyltransferase